MQHQRKSRESMENHVGIANFQSSRWKGKWKETFSKWKMRENLYTIIISIIDREER